MRNLSAFLLCALLAIPAAALASDPAVDVGVDLYRHGDYKGAVLALKKALNHGVSDPSDRATARLYLASSYEARGQKDDARNVLSDLFREQPGMPIDSALFPPSFVSLAEGVRKDVAATGPAVPTPPAGSQNPTTPVTPPPVAGSELPPVAVAPASPEVAAATPKSWAGPSGFELGVRAAFAIPFGDETSGSKLADDISGALPVEIDLGWRINPTWYLGAWLAGGPGFLKDSSDCTGCSSTVASVGIEANLHLNPLATDPWVGLGIGYELLKASATSGGFSASANLNGPMFLRLSGGVDFRASPLFAIGPYLGFSAAQFSTLSIGDTNIDIGDQKSVHFFFDIGVHATFDFH
jgi:hypothetical protein